jgi:hypothetical protein
MLSVEAPSSTLSSTMIFEAPELFGTYFFNPNNLKGGTDREMLLPIYFILTSSGFNCFATCNTGL